MKALAALALCLGLSAPAEAFMHSGPHGAAPSGAHGTGFAGPGFNSRTRYGRGYGHYGLLEGVLAGAFPPGDYRAPEPEAVAQPILVPVPVPVPAPIPAPQMTRPEGPRIIYLGHERPRRDLPRIIYGVSADP